DDYLDSQTGRVRRDSGLDRGRVGPLDRGVGRRCGPRDARGPGDPRRGGRGVVGGRDGRPLGSSRRRGLRSSS
ncbi:MAG: hypothetical protein AVDCRST_MAG77-1330, partial [uncultured Chloroflexi bacterium]